MPQPLEIDGQIFGGVVPLLALLCQRLLDDAFQFGRRIRPAEPQGRWLAVQDHGKDVGLGGAFERPPPRDHLVEHDAQTPRVGARIHRQSPALARATCSWRCP